MTGRLAAAAAIAVFALAEALPARAGLRIEEADPRFPKEVVVFWFQAGKARVDGALDGLTVIVDLKRGEGWVFERASRRYSGGRIDDLDRIVDKLEGTPNDDAVPGTPLAVSINDFGTGEQMLGYDTRRFQVLVDGEVLEELWVAPDILVASEIDLAEFKVALQKMIGAGPGLILGYEESEPYRKLRADGYPLRQVFSFVGEKITLEVTSVTVEEFPAADFAVPQGFSEITYDDLLAGE